MFCVMSEFSISKYDLVFNDDIKFMRIDAHVQLENGACVCAVQTTFEKKKTIYTEMA